MSIDKVSFVLVDLTEMPERGREQIVVRCLASDKIFIDLAASVLGVNQADFLRIALINTAKKVISENAR